MTNILLKPLSHAYNANWDIKYSIPMTLFLCSWLMSNIFLIKKLKTLTSLRVIWVKMWNGIRYFKHVTRRVYSVNHLIMISRKLVTIKEKLFTKPTKTSKFTITIISLRFSESISHNTFYFIMVIYPFIVWYIGICSLFGPLEGHFWNILNQLECKEMFDISSTISKICWLFKYQTPKKCK